MCWCDTLMWYIDTVCMLEVFFVAFCPFQNLTALGYHLGSLPVDVRSVCSAVFYHVECATVLSLHPTPYPRKTVQSWKLHTCVSYCPLQMHCSACWPGQLAFIHISVTDLGFAVSCIQQNWRKEDCVMCMLPTERSAYTASTNSWARDIILFYFYNPIITHTPFIDIQRTIEIYFWKHSTTQRWIQHIAVKIVCFVKNLGHVLAVNCCV